MSRWWRAYDDALDDPKVQALPPVLFKFWFNLLCVASKNEGLIPPLALLKQRLRARLDLCSAHLEELVKRGLIDPVDGGYEPHNWRKRQYKSDTSTDRVKRFRNGERNVSETPSDTDTDTEHDGGGDAREPLISSEAMELAEELCTFAGYDPQFVPPSWCGAAHVTEMWLAEGWQRSLIVDVVRSVMAKKRDGPPGSIKYFEKAIAKAHAEIRKPLPQVVVDNTPENVHVRRPETDRSATAAAHRLVERLREWDAPAERSEGSGNTARLLPSR